MTQTPGEPIQPLPPPTPEQLARATVRDYLARFEHALEANGCATRLLRQAREHGSTDILNDVTELVTVNGRYLGCSFAEMSEAPWRVVGAVAELMRELEQIDSWTSGDYALNEY